MRKYGVIGVVLLVTYVLGVFLTWAYLIAYSWETYGWEKGVGDEVFLSVGFGWVVGVFWPVLVASFAWSHFWFV